MRHSTAPRTAIAVLGLGLLAATGCARDAGGAGGGTVIIATAQDAGTLLPAFVQTSQERAVTEVLFDKLADLGPALDPSGDAGFVPRLAQRWEWSRDSLAITLHLDPRARWHDAKPVGALDVRFAFAVYVDTLTRSSRGGDLRSLLDSISVVDPLTCVAWFRTRSPEQFYNLVSTLVPLPEHLLGRVPRDSLRASAFARQPVGSGPFRFVRWESRQRIEVAAVDSFYRGRPKLDRVIWSIAPEMASLVQRLFAGDADFLEALPPPDVAEAAKRPELRLLLRSGFDYAYMGFNLRDGALDRPHPLFGDRALRRALAMAVDREAMRRSVFDSAARLGLGPFVRAQWSADTTLPQIPFDRSAAVRALDSLGWRQGADGMRARGGRPLAFTLLVPSSSANRQRYAVLIQEQMRLAGVRVDIESLDVNAFVDRMIKRRFDALMGSWSTTPSPSGLRQTWTSSAARTPSPFNAGRYMNPAFDAQVDSALGARDAATAKTHYRAAYRIINDDAPAIWLYEPRMVAGIHRRLVTGPLRADAWWAGLESWSVAPGGRLPRDARPSTP